MGEPHIPGTSTLRFIEFNGVDIDPFITRIKAFLGGHDFACYELIATDIGLQANMPIQPAATVRTWHEKNRKAISIICLGLPEWCVTIVNDNVGSPPNAKAGFDALVAEFRTHNPNYYADLSTFIVKCTLADFENVVMLFTELQNRNTILRDHDISDAVPVSQLIALVVSKLVADPRFDPICSRHRLNPYVGDAGFTELKRAAITIHMNSVKTQATNLPTGRTSGKPELALNAKEERPQYPDCSTCNRKHPEGKCWVQFPHLKKEYYDNLKQKKKKKEDAKLAKEASPPAAAPTAPITTPKSESEVAMQAELAAFRREINLLRDASGFEALPETGFISFESLQESGFVSTEDMDYEFEHECCGMESPDFDDDFYSTQCADLGISDDLDDEQKADAVRFNEHCFLAQSPIIPDDFPACTHSHSKFGHTNDECLRIPGDAVLLQQNILLDTDGPNDAFYYSLFAQFFNTNGAMAIILFSVGMLCLFMSAGLLFTADSTIPVADSGNLAADVVAPLEFAYTANTTDKRSFSGFRHDLLADMGASSHILDLPDRFFMRPQFIDTPITQLSGVVHSKLRGDVAYRSPDNDGVL